VLFILQILVFEFAAPLAAGPHARRRLGEKPVNRITANAGA
jgi:hypothetical protein